MPDMLVKLYDLPEDAQTACPRDESVQIRRAMAPDKFRVVEWVKEHSGLSAAGECDVCFARPAVSCFIATRGKKILGYACYDATAPDFFGPTRVLDEEQGGCAAGSGLRQRAGGDRPDAAGVRRCRTSGNGASFIRCAARPGRPGRMRGIQRAGLAALGSAGCDGPGAGAGRRTLYGARRV